MVTRCAPGTAGTHPCQGRQGRTPAHCPRWYKPTNVCSGGVEFKISGVHCTLYSTVHWAVYIVLVNLRRCFEIPSTAPQKSKVKHSGHLHSLTPILGFSKKGQFNEILYYCLIHMSIFEFGDDFEEIFACGTDTAESQTPRSHRHRGVRVIQFCKVMTSGKGINRFKNIYIQYGGTLQ